MQIGVQAGGSLDWRPFVSRLQLATHQSPGQRQMFQPCQNPECEYPANPDPQVSVGFCCEKCEGRFNGEDWAMGGKKKHTAYCTSKSMDESDWSGGMGGGGGAAWGAGFFGGGGGSGAKCAHPECNYMVNSDPSISTQFCCEKCEGLFNGEEWAEGGKRHYKNCEKIEVGSGGGGGFGGFGGGYGKAGKGGGWGEEAFGPYGTMKGMMMMMKGMKGMKGGLDGGMAFKGKGKGSGKPNPLSNFTAEQKVWIGNLPEGTTYPLLQSHFNEAGSHPKHVTCNTKNMTGIACFDNPDEAAEAILLLNGSVFGDSGQMIEVDVWSGK